MNRNITEYIRERVSEEDISRAWGNIDKYRAPLMYADSQMYNIIDELISDYCMEHDMDCDSFDPEDIFEEL